MKDLLNDIGCFLYAIVVFIIMALALLWLGYVGLPYYLLPWISRIGLP